MLPDAVESFITRWQNSGAAERANCQMFLSELCDILEVPRPDPTSPDPAKNLYVFDRAITRVNPDGSSVTNYIDLYKAGHFVNETKQGVSDCSVGLRRTGAQLYHFCFLANCGCWPTIKVYRLRKSQAVIITAIRNGDVGQRVGADLREAERLAWKALFVARSSSSLAELAGMNSLLLKHFEDFCNFCNARPRVGVSERDAVEAEDACGLAFGAVR